MVEKKLKVKLGQYRKIPNISPAMYKPLEI